MILGTRLHIKGFTNIVSFNPHNNPKRKVLLILTLQIRDWGSKRQDGTKVTQVGSVESAF